MSAYNDIMERIRRAALSVKRDPAEISLVAVSKNQPSARVRELAAEGASVFGENRAQEALPKMKELNDLHGLNFHFIGRLQSNKVKQVVGEFSLIHSVDRLSLAQEINSVAKKKAMVQDILLQAKLSGEEQKGGVPPGEIDKLLHDVLAMENVRLRGFMLIPPFFDEPERNRELFQEMRRLFDKKKDLSVAIDTLSMGMSDDFEIAIQEGSTMVRIGTALFGQRM